MPTELLPLTVAIVCKDSDRTIARTLEAVAGWASEILAVDSGSTDTTLELLEKHGATIVHSDWLGHVKTKQKALDACSQPWVLCLDSDESPDETLKASIAAVINRNDDAVAAGTLNRKVWYRGRFLNHAWQPERRLRLVRKGAAAWGGIDPHDKLIVASGKGRAVDLAGTLRHDSFVTFGDQLRKDAGYAELMAANLYAAGKRSSRLRLITSPAGAFAKQIIIKQAWRDGTAGWLAAAATAASTLHKHARLLELGLIDRESKPGP